MRRVLPVALAAAVLVLGGCTSDPSLPGQAKINVDTPALVAMKKDAGVADCAPGDASPVDGGLPAVTLPCFGGGPDVDLSSLKGPLVINLWQATCAPCRKEMPVLQEFHEKYGDRVGVIGVDYQDVQTEPAMQLVKRSGVTYPLLADPDGDISAKSPFPVIRGLPLFAFVAADGTVQLASGGIDSLDDMVALANEHLGTDL
jgi:thiol-disulfide isomerase/thioredoxin